ncbi:VOC family protein [Candidatus Enterococcus leclercqii]|uniref:VOC family protein n=1 Tax=Candidatus Enterococcus leclercqii TaxID=1857218 RepID=UPI00192A22F8|nr:VOC family protein [Enterococcus sp. CU9D]
MKFKLGKETQLETVAIRVKNRDAMIQFYRDVIGFTLKREENELAIMGNSKNKNESLWLEESPRAEDYFGEVKKLRRICLVIPSEGEMADVLSRIEGAGWPIIDALYDEGVMGILLEDPEGNQLELYYGANQQPVSGKPEPLNRKKLLAKAAGEFPVLSDCVFFDKLHLNTAVLEDESRFLAEVLGFEVRDETAGIHVLNEGLFHIGLTEARGGTVELPTDKVLGLDFLKFRLSQEDLEALATHLEALGQSFYKDKRGSIVTVYDPTGLEWWFVRKK